MSITNLLLAVTLLLSNCVGSALATEKITSAILKVESRSPLRVSASIQGKLYTPSLPADFMSQVDGLYSDVHIDDLNGDGEWELVFDLVGSDVNHCSKVLHYNENDHSFSEWLFKGGGLCNPISRGAFLISSYRDGASWTEDVYIMKDGKPDLHITDSCVGCYEVRRKMYVPGKQPVKVLVTDDVEFERRIPLKASVTSLRAKVFSFPDSGWPTKKYLIRGDKITLMDFDKSKDGQYWAEFSFIGANVTTVGWLKYSDLE